MKTVTLLNMELNWSPIERHGLLVTHYPEAPELGDQCSALDDTLQAAFAAIMTPLTLGNKVIVVGNNTFSSPYTLLHATVHWREDSSSPRAIRLHFAAGYDLGSGSRVDQLTDIYLPDAPYAAFKSWTETLHANEKASRGLPPPAFLPRPVFGGTRYAL